MKRIFLLTLLIGNSLLGTTNSNDPLIALDDILNRVHYHNKTRVDMSGMLENLPHNMVMNYLAQLDGMPITHLDISNNSLTLLPKIALPQLEWINVSGNFLNSFPEQLIFSNNGAFQIETAYGKFVMSTLSRIAHIEKFDMTKLLAQSVHSEKTAPPATKEALCEFDTDDIFLEQFYFCDEATGGINDYPPSDFSPFIEFGWALAESDYKEENRDDVWSQVNTFHKNQKPPKKKMRSRRMGMAQILEQVPESCYDDPEAFNTAWKKLLKELPSESDKFLARCDWEEYSCGELSFEQAKAKLTTWQNKR